MKIEWRTGPVAFFLDMVLGGATLAATGLAVKVIWVIFLFGWKLI